MDFTFPSSLDAFDEGDGWPRPRWDAIWAWADANVPSRERHAAACAFERQWLDRLARHLGGGYAVAESDNLLLLADPADVDSTELLELAEDILRLIRDALEDAVNTDVVGKLPILYFSEDDDFYDYISAKFADGHFGRFIGMCIRDGDVHVALRCPEAERRHTLAHEMTHACLSHLSLPLWLEEGVVEVVMRRVCDMPPRHFDAITREHLYSRWSWHGLHLFWSGVSFYRPDELQALSYELAEALVRLMNANDPAAFGRFLKAARHADGGERGCREILGKSVTAFVTTLLGDGPWFPPPPAGTDAAAET